MNVQVPTDSIASMMGPVIAVDVESSSLDIREGWSMAIESSGSRFRHPGKVAAPPYRPPTEGAYL